MSKLWVIGFRVALRWAEYLAVALRWAEYLAAARYSAHRRATRKPITHNLLICSSTISASTLHSAPKIGECLLLPSAWHSTDSCGWASTQSLPSVVSTHLIMPLFMTLSGTSTISLSPSNAPKQTNWAEAPPFPSRNHPGPVHSAPIVPSTDMSEGFPALTHALYHSFASVMAHLCLTQPAINSSAICSPERGI